ncbi:MAG: alpha/beta fold hydrolase [Fimbriimonas sp.]
MMPPSEFFTPSGVRLRRRSQRPGSLNWLFFPGGPGIGSESLHGLMDALDVPGTLWGVDLPWDGSNQTPNGATCSPYSDWPNVLVEAAQAVPNAVAVGHSTGGMYLLSTPELEPHVLGIGLVSTAPDAAWRSRFFEMTQRHPLPEVDAATARYEAEPTPDHLRDIAVASAEWNFAPEAVETGRALLAAMPYCASAVDWSDRHFDDGYAARWWPKALPTLILSGGDDRIVDQTLWNRPKYRTPNVRHRTVTQGAHFPWIEDPKAVREAFQEFAVRLDARP